MEEEKEKSVMDAWKELMSSIHFLMETKTGKITLEAYINKLSDFVDDYIRKAQTEEDCQFESGYVEVVLTDKDVNFSIFLSFLDRGGGAVEKVLRKSVPGQQFTDNDLLQLRQEKKVYIVNAPEGK